MANSTTVPPASRLHHHAYVVHDQEATRHFYEDVLGFPLTATWCEVEDVRGRKRTYCHTFFSLTDGSALAFFQFADPEDTEELALDSSRSLNHVALATDPAGQAAIARRLDDAGIAHRTVDHGYCTSLYVTDPDGLTVEFTVDAPDAAELDERQRATAHDELRRWLAGDHRPNNDARGS
ncbi:MAG: VOC family protein [Acidimicrobiia bacterium]|nr:VOC family protein [Acidimicrobiia bacterium]